MAAPTIIETMELKLKRIARKEDYTIGKLYIDGVYFCDTLEDTDRGMKQDMQLPELKEIKVAGRTAIPTGKYCVYLTKSPRFGRVLPLVYDVPAFSGIRIHSGNTHDDTQGCILVGQNKIVGRVINSRQTMDKLMELLDGQSITIVIE